MSRNETTGKRAGAGLGAALLAVVLGAAAPAPHAAAPPPPSTTTVAMKRDGGVYVVPVAVNGAVTVDCIVDSGASDMNIPADVFEALVRKGAIRDSDFLGTRVYTLADGSSERGRLVRIKSLKVGNVVVNDVVASVGGDDSSGLLGQSFLGRFRSWSVNNGSHALVLVGPPSAAEPRPAEIRTPRTDDGPLTANGGQPGGTAPDGSTVAQVSSHHAAPSNSRPSHRAPEPDDGALTSQDGH